jgi:hypothetical protein
LLHELDVCVLGISILAGKVSIFDKTLNLKSKKKKIIIKKIKKKK